MLETKMSNKVRILAVQHCGGMLRL